ncbi:MAG TPA: HNH endonuclease [Acidothermaceae bacterium]|nr:HNH endonuclease [Acidothermaceae bacterium]
MELVDSSFSVSRSQPELSLDELGARIVDGSGRLAAATCRWLLLVAEFDARDGNLAFGLASTAQWLSHACGIAHRTAVEHVRVARSLRLFPRLAGEMGAGRLSFSQVRAISRLAQPGEQALVEDLIPAAQHATVAQLEVVVRGLRTVDHNEQATDPGEYLKQSWTADSRWQLSARLDPERGALVGAAIDAIVGRDGCSPAEALFQLAEIGLATIADGKNPSRELRGHECAAVVIHLDAARVPPRSAERDPDAVSCEPGDAPIVARPYARIAGGPGLSDRVVQRLLCEGRIRTVIHDAASNVLDVGRSHRLVTDRQYRALLLRQHGQCAHPGCPNTKNLHAHHRIHWIHGGRTDLNNLLLLCERHHVAHHAGAFEILTDCAGKFRFVSSDGRNLSAPLRRSASRDSRLLEDEHADLAPDAATARWDGQRLDHRYAISVLAQRRQAS